MAAVMMETQSVRRPYFSAIRWTAIWGGLAAGLGSYLLLALLGLATGLTAVNPQAAQPVGGVPVGMGIWTGLVTLISAFIGGFVAARMSGLARASDGVLHGFVSWGASTVLFAYLATTAVSAVLGGTFALLGQGIQGATSAASSAAGAAGGQQGAGASQGGGITNQLERIITGRQGGQIQMSDLNQVQSLLRSGDREGAVNYMVNQMGFSRDRANQVVDQAGPLFSGQAGQEVKQAATKTVGALAATSWWLFIGLGLSLILALWGGALGARSFANRTKGDHSGERRVAAG